MTATLTATDYIGKCSTGHAVRLSAADALAQAVVTAKNGTVTIKCFCLGKGYMPAHLRPIVPTVTKYECGPRCTSATGFKCDCKCGGHNHGADHQ